MRISEMNASGVTVHLPSPRGSASLCCFSSPSLPPPLILPSIVTSLCLSLIHARTPSYLPLPLLVRHSSVPRRAGVDRTRPGTKSGGGGGGGGRWPTECLTIFGFSFFQENRPDRQNKQKRQQSCVFFSKGLLLNIKGSSTC